MFLLTNAPKAVLSKAVLRSPFNNIFLRYAICSSVGCCWPSSANATAAVSPIAWIASSVVSVSFFLSCSSWIAPISKVQYLPSQSFKTSNFCSLVMESSIWAKASSLAASNCCPKSWIPYCRVVWYPWMTSYISLYVTLAFAGFSSSGSPSL